MQKSAKTVPAGKERQEVSLADLFLYLHGAEHAGFHHPETQGQQAQSQNTADEESGAPVKGLGDEVCQNRTGNTY